MKKILITLIIISYAFSGNFDVAIAFIGQFPQGEFKNEGVPTGFGFDINGLWYPSGAVGLGLNLGLSQYGSSERKIPFSGYTDLITITEKTTNGLSYGHLLLKIIPFQGNVRPYFEGLLGKKILALQQKLFPRTVLNKKNAKLRLQLIIPIMPSVMEVVVGWR